MRTAAAAPARYARSGVPPVAARIKAATTPVASGPKVLEKLLVQMALTKDQEAFASLYAATKAKLFSTVLPIVGRPDFAEDIIQEVYVRIWFNAHSYQAASGSPMTWMITIARNLAIDAARKSLREMSADDTELLALPCDGPTAVEVIEAAEDQRAANEQRHRIFLALQAIDPARRDLVIAAYLHGASRAELSRRAGVPVNTVKTWIRRALLEVQAMLRDTEHSKQARTAHTGNLPNRPGPRCKHLSSRPADPPG